MELTGDVVEIGDGSGFVVGGDLERGEGREDLRREERVGERVGLINGTERELNE